MNDPLPVALYRACEERDALQARLDRVLALCDEAEAAEDIRSEAGKQAFLAMRWLSINSVREAASAT